MIEQGIIEASANEWAFPIVVVKKKDGALRICIDYRKLHAVTKVDAYLRPLVDDIINHAGQAQQVTTLDLTKSY